MTTLETARHLLQQVLTRGRLPADLRDSITEYLARKRGRARKVSDDQIRELRRQGVNARQIAETLTAAGVAITEDAVRKRLRAM